MYPKHLLIIAILLFLYSCDKEKKQPSQPAQAEQVIIKPLKKQRELHYTSAGECYAILETEYSYDKSFPVRMNYTLINMIGRDTSKSKYADVLFYNELKKLQRNEFRTVNEKGLETLNSTVKFEYVNNRIKYSIVSTANTSQGDTTIYLYLNGITHLAPVYSNLTGQYYTTDIDSSVSMGTFWEPEHPDYNRIIYTYSSKEDLAFKYLKSYLVRSENITGYERVKRSEIFHNGLNKDDYSYTRSYNSENYPVNVSVTRNGIKDIEIEYFY